MEKLKYVSPEYALQLDQLADTLRLGRLALQPQVEPAQQELDFSQADQ